MKQSTSNSTNSTHEKSDDRARGVERLELVRRGREEGKSRRRIAEELGCDDGKVRSDIERLSLPPDKLAAIQNGDSAEKYLDEVRTEKTGQDQKVIKQYRKRLSEEKKKKGIHSSEAAKDLSAWLVKKEPNTTVQQVLLKDLKEYCQNIPDQPGPPRSDVAKVFALCEQGESSSPSTDRVNLFVRVMASGLVHIAPEKVIRDTAIDKALIAARSRKPYPPEPPCWAKEKARQHMRRAYED